MAEPAGILLECQISEAALTALLKRKLPAEPAPAPIGRIIAQELDLADADGDIVILHHDPATGMLFFAAVLNHFAADRLDPFWPLLGALAEHAGDGAGAVTSTLPDPQEAIHLQQGQLVRQPADQLDPQLVDRLLARLFSFARKGQFPTAADSFRRKGHHAKALRKYWTGYLDWRDQQERPAKIAAATMAAPYRLYDDILTADGLVFQRDSFTRRDIVFPGADPLTMRRENQIHADGTHVWQRQLAAGSPPEVIDYGPERGTINNPAAIWEYVPVPGALGGAFRWLFDRWDTLFWTDGQRIYAEDAERRLTPLPGMQARGFRMLGACFGTDGVKVAFKAQILALDPDHAQTKAQFIWDRRNSYLGGVQLPLSGAGFAIIGEKRLTRGLGPTYRITDGSQTLMVEPWNRITADDPALWAD